MVLWQREGSLQMQPSSLSESFPCRFLASHARETETCEGKGERLTRIGFPKCAVATLACPMCGAASFYLILHPGRMQPFPDLSFTSLCPPSRGAPRALALPYLERFRVCVGESERVPCARAARSTTHIQLPRSPRGQSPGVSLGTNEVIREGRVTNSSCTEGAVK